ncbi:AraC family transcriptional regulator [Pseudofrankia inefficax]|uniref:Helix-turn-helix, AraC domain protein n=1 Tax=Pseudofrankia inefficax (strain DSM 45817 / CECT 9037 / DDB 130130 / EuI1c) TaxID=298654 RepID=E3J7N7_PSEI1|nr:helix-turn-helix transcriptional regulator [Pseudofrankia inefficax]ADP79646.1 Helix-turn-helix, AraC domain protein [Pseudofrankia inefficax]
MSISRHDRAEPAVRGYAVTHPPGVAALPIQAGWDQLLYTASGAMTISTPAGSWFIPPHRALWIPDGAQATVRNRSPAAVRNLYFATPLGVAPPRAQAVAVPERFGRELLLHAVRRCPLDLGDPVHAALLTVLVDQLRGLPEASVWLPWPSDPRASDLATALVADPAAGLTSLAHRVGASRRTLERAFGAETGLSLGAWRRRARILSSLDTLAAGASVTQAAIEAGYATPSAYVAAFKQELGQTPRHFLNG